MILCQFKLKQSDTDVYEISFGSKCCPDVRKNNTFGDEIYGALRNYVISCCHNNELLNVNTHYLVPFIAWNIHV